MKRRFAIALIVVVALLLVAALALRWAIRPQVLGPRVLDMAGQALGLEISADGFDYRLLGGPRLVARGVSARVPDGHAPIMQAERVLVAVPWSTLRTRGADPAVTRVELDAPQVQLDPFMRWWSQRPRGDGPLPTLREGLRVERGRIDGGDWWLEDISIDLPHLAPDARVAAGVRGRYQAATTQVTFDLQVAMTRPAVDAGIGAAGSVTPRTDGWRLPSQVVASTRLAAPPRLPTGPDAGTGLQRLRLSANSRYLSAETSQPFTLGLAAEGTFADGALKLAPASLALRGEEMIPRLRGSGHLDIGQRLQIGLAGNIERWPDTWPALPSPIGESRAPLPFELHYSGAANLSTPLELRLAHDEARFEGSLRVAEVAAWFGDIASGSPLLPLDGRLTVPRVDVAGASLHGVEVTIQNDSSPEAEQP